MFCFLSHVGYVEGNPNLKRNNSVRPLTSDTVDRSRIGVVWRPIPRPIAIPRTNCSRARLSRAPSRAPSSSPFLLGSLPALLPNQDGWDFRRLALFPLGQPRDRFRHPLLWLLSSFFRFSPLPGAPVAHRQRLVEIVAPLPARARALASRV